MMKMYKLKLTKARIALLIGTFLCIGIVRAASITSSSLADASMSIMNEDQVAEKLKIMQVQLMNILACFTIIIHETSASNPPPASLAHNSTILRNWYNTGLWTNQLGVNRPMEPNFLSKPYHYNMLSQIIIRGWTYGGYSYKHFDSATYRHEFCNRYGFDKDRINGLKDLSLFRDPFSDAYYLTYIGVYDDFYLISSGPDGDSDVVPYRQRWSDAKYDIEGKVVSLDDQEHEFLVQRPTLDLLDVSKAQDSNEVKVTYEDILKTGKYVTTNSLKTIESHLVYDPTNGLVSNGDIVFHRYGRDNIFFKYPEKRMLEKQDITFKVFD